MKRLLLTLALAFQLLVPAWMAADREMIVRNGERIHLRTAPIDPRDIFRGDYVRLDYEVSTLGGHQLSEDLTERSLPKHQVIFTRLAVGSGGLANATSASLNKPESGPFLRGRTQQAWTAGKGYGALRVNYGIEKYFVQQGKGIEMENRRGQRQDVQIPLEMEVALDSNGTAVLTGHRWSKLGIGLAASRTPVGNAPAGQRTAVMALTLKNVSDEPLDLLLLPNQCSFSLQSVKAAPQRLSLGGTHGLLMALSETSAPQSVAASKREECKGLEPLDEFITRLAPDEQIEQIFDFNQPGWQVTMDGAPTTIGELPWAQRFRLVYQPPDLPGRPNLWRGELPSRAFHGRGQVD